MSNTPLPEPDGILVVGTQALRAWTISGMESHAAAVSAAENAALRESLDDAESLCVAKQSEIDALRNLRHEQVERIKMLEDALRGTERELQSCQSVIHLAGGFDPAYVRDAQAALKAARAALGDKTPNAKFSGRP